MRRSPFRALAIVGLALALACSASDDGQMQAADGGGEASAPSSAGTESGSPVAGRPAGAAPRLEIDWQDPEPAGVQEQAEAVVAAEWNRDKTTRLEMRITTLVDRTTGIEGFVTTLEKKQISLEDRLDQLGAEVTETEVTIRLPGSVLFDFDKHDIRPDAERTLLEVVEVIQGYESRPVRIEGHTDSIASDAYNQQLSERRASSVKAWLVARGVSVSRLSTIGHGESRPVADNATAAGRQQNRRVEIIIAKSA